VKSCNALFVDEAKVGAFRTFLEEAGLIPKDASQEIFHEIPDNIKGNILVILKLLDVR